MYTFYTALFLLIIYVAAHRSKRIVGGGPVVNGELSSGAISIRSSRDVTRHLCGGVVIHPHWVLTAAHCTVNKQFHQIIIVFENIHQFEVKRIINHFYDKYTGKNDLALLQTKQIIEGGHVMLPPSNYKPSGTCTVCGYGTLNYHNKTMPETLHSALVEVVSMHECQMAVGEYPNLASDMLCAGGNNTDACQGDSGSPLFCPWNNSLVLAGTVSFGFGCGTLGIPGVYMDIASHRDWIDWALTSALYENNST